MKNGAVDVGLEISQTGGAIKSYGLTIVETVMRSQTSIYTHAAVRKDPERRELLEMFLLNLYGATNAESKVMLLFNVPNTAADQVDAYLRANNLFGEEPTVNRGREFAEYNIQVDAADAARPVALVRYTLAKLGARSINTVPVTSSIPGIRAVRPG